ncbi:TetR/AcrR family transcriptional regulator [Aquabacterium sp. OR-4]|uniref:TetR/AcrR family transcriptional regulator n=1 Tax=Aquabacterium sp. OR-4 TaxID=2978127 RepID=UPI0021B35B3F|nr:TetR/AcrR family transcriptional regulator [Aquabacterium sp. OR-4]MDT7835689.1 TetR/AcrR family transcriptional regulator [Aquabacterium sp. OR-4]
MSGAGTARFEAKREAILDGAARLFNQQGIRGGTLADVARSVGLATNSITYYYRRKEDLACACLQRAIDALSTDAATAMALDDTLAGRVRGFLGRHLARLADIAEGRHPELVVFADLRTLAPPHGTEVACAYTLMFKQLRQLLDTADAPALPRAALNARTHLLLSTVSWARVWLLRFEPIDYALVAERMATLLLDGLASPGALARPGQAVAGAGAAPPDAAWPDPALPEAILPIAPEATGSTDDTAVAYLRAATRLVNEHGYHGASVERIAAELQLTKGSFYHHHETKEELIAACFARSFAVMRAAQSAAMAAGPAQADSGLARLALACRSLLAFQTGPQGPLLRITAWTALPEAIRRDTQRTMRRLGERFASFVIDGLADGSVRVVDPSVAAQVVSGMINATAEMERWVPGLHAGNAFALFAMPLFTGLRCAPADWPGSDAAPAVAEVAAPRGDAALACSMPRAGPAMPAPTPRKRARSPAP